VWAGPEYLESADRLVALDILRGLALFGMILVHFHQKTRLDSQGFEDLIGWGVYVLVEQKAWGTFAFLFGAGVGVFLRRLEARHAPVTSIYLRRMTMLAVFGVIADLCFGFRILFAYACSGLALFVIRRWFTRALLAAAVVSACARPVAAELSAWHSWWSGAPVSADASALLRQAVEAAAQQGDYFTLLSARWALFAGTFPHMWRGFLPDINLALFILGFLAVRSGVFDEPRRHVRLIFSWMTLGALSWGASWAVLRHLPPVPAPGADWPLADGLGLIHDQWLCLTYVGAVVLLLAFRPMWKTWLAPVGCAGRMALTNYMVQAGVLDVLSSGYGFALHLRPLVYGPAAVLLFGLEAAASWAWLTRYRFGPLEWLWRTVTYAQVQTLRRPAALATSSAVR
jgi:uncharacterized protein